MPQAGTIAVLDVSTSPYCQRLCAAALQGLANRDGPRVFIDYGVYDDPDARRTNEVFIDDELWFGKFRDILGDQDGRNLDYYERAHGLVARRVGDLGALADESRAIIAGCALWDSRFPDTANVALMLAAQENLLPIDQSMELWAERLGLPLVHDLRGRWADRVELYRWAFDNLFGKCREGVVACVEPEWRRPEFADYIVQNKVFVYSLASGAKSLGCKLLMLLAFGPARLREVLFSLRLDAPLRRGGLALLGLRSAEARLSNRIQRAVPARPFPTIFGWHTKRDDELAFMLQLSANGLRLVPSHLAGNFSFHGKVSPLGLSGPEPAPPKPLDPDGIYVTFTLSDGDQLMMMNTGELGSWYSPRRGTVPFNWEVQPLLKEMAPALYERYSGAASAADCLVAGPSGAGYMIPPLSPALAAYMGETVRLCREAGIRVVTSYIADPPGRVLRQLARRRGELLGFLSGYAIVERAPQASIDGCPFVANEIPLAANIPESSALLLDRVRERIRNPGTLPRFIGVHLFAYRTSLDDVARFIGECADERVHFVRADEFLLAAEQHYARKKGRAGGIN